MDCKTGLIHNESLLRQMLSNSAQFPGPRFIEVQKDEMTPKQTAAKKVSLHDNRSMLGMRLSAQRNQACPCGSGKKFKYCCLNV